MFFCYYAVRQAVCSPRSCGRHLSLLIKKFLKSLIPTGRPNLDQSPALRVLSAEEHGLQVSSVSKGARKVADTLTEAGFSAELVGGCVRDLLLGERPKDFDVVTSASPEEVRQVFPRSRMVGRRFRIVHVRMGREMIEVSTSVSYTHLTLPTKRIV